MVERRRSLRFVRDPIHDYVPFSWLEEVIIDSPLFQRLRYISQNAIAHQTYPSNRTARFTHSLGTMHLGGQFFEAIVRNSDVEVLDAFSNAVGSLIEFVCETHMLDFDKVIRHLTDEPDSFYRHLGFEPRDKSAQSRTLAERICVLQGIRLACVLHDIGHPVFSHTGEAVLDAQLAIPPVENQARIAFRSALLGADASEQHRALHESLGARIMDRILRKSIPEGDGLTFSQVCLHLARGIVRERIDGFEDPDGVLKAMHGIVSGEVDADRADYVQRDGYASAFEFGTYDLQRIILSLRLVRLDGDFAVRPSTAALSAVESFFVERFRIYRWLVFHHSVMRGQLAAQRALYLLFSIHFGDLNLGSRTGSLRECLSRYDFDRLWEPFSKGGDIDRFKACDENWMITLFRALLDEPALSTPALPRTLAELKSCLRVVCERDKSHFRPLWKRLDEYQQFAGEFQLAAQGDSFDEFFADERVAALASGRARDPVKFLNAVMAQQFPMELGRSVPFPGGDVALFSIFEEAIASEWPDAPGLLVFTYKAGMKPGAKAGYSLVDVGSGDAPLDIRSLSAQVQALDDLWARDTQAWAFIVPGKKQDTEFEVEQALVTPEHRTQFAQAAARVLLNKAWRARLTVSAPSAEAAGESS